MRHMKRLLLIGVMLPLLAFAQEDEAAASRAAAAQTLRASIGALRSTYTADIEFDTPELDGMEFKPTISYKQRVFADGTGDLQADMEHIPLPEEVPAGLQELSFGFLHTAEGNAVRLLDEAVQRDGSGDEEDPFAQLLNTLNEIPMPTDEELAAMDLRQETEVIDGVECQMITWIPEEYNPDDPKSVAMHCVAFGTEDHFLRSYVALDSNGEQLFSLRFKNINPNPVFGPEDFTFGPGVKVTHVNTDEEFGMEIQKLFMKTLVQAALKPKSKRKRHTAGAVSPSVPAPAVEVAEIEPEVAGAMPESPLPPAEPRHRGLWFFVAGMLLAVAVCGILFWFQKRKVS